MKFSNHLKNPNVDRSVTSFLSSAVTDDHHFRNDSMLLYQFNLDLDQRRRMSDVLILDDTRRMSTDSRSSNESQETPVRTTESRDIGLSGNWAKITEKSCGIDCIAIVILVDVTMYQNEINFLIL